jgi:hypothetical protein
MERGRVVLGVALRVGLGLTFVACGGGTPTREYAIKATVSDLVVGGTGLTLRMNDDAPVSVASAGEVTLGQLPDGASYAVAVTTQPSGPAQTCTVAHATGTVSAGDVTDVAVACSAPGMSIAMVKVGDAGNPEQPTKHRGAVAYEYYIGTYEVSNAEYAAFLNTVAATDT